MINLFSKKWWKFSPNEEKSLILNSAVPMCKNCKRRILVYATRYIKKDIETYCLCKNPELEFSYTKHEHFL